VSVCLQALSRSHFLIDYHQNWHRRKNPQRKSMFIRGSILFCPVWGRGNPLPPLSIYFLIFSPFYFSLSFIGFTYFLLLSIPSLSTRIVPLRFQAGGRRRRPNLALVCFFVLYFVLSVFLSLNVFWCFVVFHFVLCVFLQCFDTVGWVI